jgi:hypothetical protein
LHLTFSGPLSLYTANLRHMRPLTVFIKSTGNLDSSFLLPVSVPVYLFGLSHWLRRLGKKSDYIVQQFSLVGLDHEQVFPTPAYYLLA